MKKCTKCGDMWFELEGDTYDRHTYSIRVTDEGEIRTEELVQEVVEDTDWHGNMRCWGCGANFDRETFALLPSAEELYPFTVLLLYPDYIADEFGKETYLAQVYAEGGVEAVRKAQKQVLAANLDWCDVDEADFHVLLTLRGHWNDLTPDRR